MPPTAGAEWVGVYVEWASRDGTRCSLLVPSTHAFTGRVPVSVVSDFLERLS